MHMGDYIIIERQTGPFEFDACSVSTGTGFHARVDEDKRTLFSDREWIDRHPSACPFLRPGEDRFFCCIHETSPVQCKAYRCVVARIWSPGGEMVGYITGTLALHGNDPYLREIWEEVEEVMRRNPDLAEEEIFAILARRGFSCD
jgi:Fe-S-cluster containining protein